MKQIVNKIFLFLVCSTFAASVVGQKRILIHSHNDYRQCVPFYQAYAQQIASIEVDIFAKDGNLLVAHDEHELSTAPSIEELYLNPIINLYKQNGGKAWKNSDYILTLLVDLKTSYDPTLDLLIEKLKKNPEVFDPLVNPQAVRVVISGNRPDPQNFDKYPLIVSFDGDNINYTEDQLKRISMISLSLKTFTKWNGKGAIVKRELDQIKRTISAVHALNKPIRFWGTPDGVTAWNTYLNLGVDYINTDRVEACAAFFHKFENKHFYIAANQEEASDGVSLASRLDKTTVNFQGFRNKNLHLSKGIDVYMPTYRNDGVRKPVKNVIFLIGDGMSIAQLQAGATVNRLGNKKGNGLSVLNMKFLGFQNSCANDTYTTDSAAAGSALATGKKHDNRHISISSEGEKYQSLTDIAYDKGLACGVISLGNLADATPAAFYGHSVERDDSDIITTYLLDGKLTVLNGSGMSVFTERKDNIDLLGELKSQYEIFTNIEDINSDNSKKVICVDERMGAAASEQTLDLLANATNRTIEKLVKSNKNKGFFLMVEGAKIDYAGHANSLPGSVLETLSFDLAVAAALKYADSNGETLVVVTGDHETGGLTLVDGNLEKGYIVAQYMTDDHTALMLPVFAYGPGAADFMGVYENTEIFEKIKKLLK